MSKAQIVGLADVQPASNGQYNYAQTHLLVGLLLSIRDTQLAAADLTTSYQMFQDAPSPQGWFIANNVCAVGESMTIDVKYIRSGAAAVSALTGLFTYDGSKAKNTLYALPFDAAKDLLQGDIVQIVRDYTAGGGPTPMGGNSVIVLPRPNYIVPNGEFST